MSSRMPLNQFSAILSIQDDFWQGETLNYLTIRSRRSVGRVDVTPKQAEQIKKILGCG